MVQISLNLQKDQISENNINKKTLLDQFSAHTVLLVPIIIEMLHSAEINTKSWKQLYIRVMEVSL